MLTRACAYACPPALAPPLVPPLAPPARPPAPAAAVCCALQPGCRLPIDLSRFKFLTLKDLVSAAELRQGCGRAVAALR